MRTSRHPNLVDPSRQAARSFVSRRIMRLLALDTSLAACGVVVASHELASPVVVAETVERAHGERLLGMISDAMAEAGLRFQDLDRIAVTTGPGSFTGLRVGIAAARGLALVTSRPLVGIGNLAIHAEHARRQAGTIPVMAATRAGKGSLYAQPFGPDGNELAPPRAGSAEDVASAVEPGMLLAGSGADAVRAAAGTGKASIAHRLHEPDLSSFCRLALAAPPADQQVRPLYLRSPDAKPQASAAVARQ